MRRKQKKNLIQFNFFATDSKAAASKLQCCSADLCASSSFFGGSKWPEKKNQSSSSKKKIFYIFWFIYLWSRRKKSFAQQAERWAAYVLDFSSKWETPIICHQERLRKNPLKIRIYSSFFSRKKEEIIIIILEKKDFMTHINKLFSNLSKHTI